MIIYVLCIIFVSNPKLKMQDYPQLDAFTWTLAASFASGQFVVELGAGSRQSSLHSLLQLLKVFFRIQVDHFSDQDLNLLPHFLHVLEILLELGPLLVLGGGDDPVVEVLHLLVDVLVDGDERHDVHGVVGGALRLHHLGLALLGGGLLTLTLGPRLLVLLLLLCAGDEAVHLVRDLLQGLALAAVARGARGDLWGELHIQFDISTLIKYSEYSGKAPISFCLLLVVKCMHLLALDY